MSNDAEAQEVHPARPAAADATPPDAIPEAARPAAAGATPADAIPEAARPAAAGATPPDANPEAARPRVSANGDAGMAGDPERIRERWAAIQATFVDDPRGSVAAAAELVNETITALVASAEQRERGLRGEWDREGVDTENLRNTLRNYRGLLDRLVAI